MMHVGFFLGGGPDVGLDAAVQAFLFPFFVLRSFSRTLALVGLVCTQKSLFRFIGSNHGLKAEWILLLQRRPSIVDISIFSLLFLVCFMMGSEKKQNEEKCRLALELGRISWRWAAREEALW